MQWNIKNKVMITIKKSQINQISALNYSKGIDMLWNN